MENYKQTKRFENFIRLAVTFLVLLVCVATFSFVKLGSAKRENERYDKLIASLTSENLKIQQSISNSTDEAYLENQVRDNLGMSNAKLTSITIPVKSTGNVDGEGNFILTLATYPKFSDIGAATNVSPTQTAKIKISAATYGLSANKSDINKVITARCNIVMKKLLLNKFKKLF